MTVIKQQDFIDSIYDALQYISYYHPVDFIRALKKAYEREQNVAAKNAIAQILVNSKMCAIGHRPLCQDTGIVTCFVKIGMQVQFDGDMTVAEMVNEGTRRAYTDPNNPLRKSVLTDPIGARVNTKDNTPAVTHIEMVPGDKVEVLIASKGGGSENKSKLVMLNPSDSIEDWILEQIPHMGAGWCPPGIIGVGVGGTMEKAAVLAKEALMDPIDIEDLIAKGAETSEEKLRLSLYDKINKTGIGAQGLGGLTTVLDVKVKSYPTHAVAKPVAIIPNCAASRHIHFELDGTGPCNLVPPFLRNFALGKCIIESSGSGRHRQGVVQLVIYIFDEVHQKRRHIQHTADLRVFLYQRVSIIISLPAFVHIFGKRNEQRRGIALLNQIPQVQQPRHSSVAIKIGVQIGNIEMDQCRLEQIVHRCLILNKANQIPHAVVQFLPTDAGVLQLLTDNIDCIVPIIVPRQ